MSDYVDKELGIKTAKGLEKYLKKQLGIDIRVYKLATRTLVLYAIDSVLHEEFISGSVIYVMKVDDVNKVIENIKTNL
jgi:hypothetical protein